MKRVIVTGANGFIGSSLIKRLVEKKIQVLAVDISFEENHLVESEYITTLLLKDGDLSELEELARTEAYDTFYHMAWRGVNGAQKADPIVQTQNIQMTLENIRVAKQLGCKRFLAAGTVAEQAVGSLERLQKTGGGMTYGVAKYCTRLMVENYCKNIGMNYVWMQFSNIYGPTNKTGNLISYTLTQLMKNEEAVFGPAQQPYDFVYVDDLLEAVYRLGECAEVQGTYFIGSGESRILREYLLTIGRLCEKEELIKLNVREDDGIRYRTEMFDINPLKGIIGDYVSMPFEKGLLKTKAEF